MSVHIDLLYGQQAQTALDDHRFLALWRSLHDKCPHSTAFQAPNFVRTWYAAYRAHWQPVIIQSQDSKGDLVGLWLLAYNPFDERLAHAGAQQAEYHTWVSLSGEDIPFLSAAWPELKRRFAFTTLRFRYLPTAELSGMLQTALGTKNTFVRRRHRPFLNLSADVIKKSFQNKANKSKLNRLRKLGKLEFRRLTTSTELESVLEDLITYYDFQMSTAYHIAPPFLQADPQKRKFHVDMFAAAPADNCVTVTYLDERPIAAFWGAVSGKTVHLGMVMHSPFLAKHSPGKLHLMQLSEHLLKEGKEVLDLTPGGEPWKERCANAHDDVAEAVICASPWVARWTGTLEWGKQCADRVGVTPADVNATLARLDQLRPSAVARKVRNWAEMKRELCLYRCDRTLAERYRHDERVRCNSLCDLLSFGGGELGPSRDAFLSTAQARLEQGQSAYTISLDNRLAYCGWMASNPAEFYIAEVKQSTTFPTASVLLHDIYMDPEVSDRGLHQAAISHMVCAASVNKETRYVYIAVSADNLRARDVIERMGFEYQGSLFREGRFGIERKWMSRMLAQSADGNCELPYPRPVSQESERKALNLENPL